MKDTSLDKLLCFEYLDNGYYKSANQKTEEYSLMCRKGEIVYHNDATKRDLNFHKAYMALIANIYDYMPIHFKDKVPKSIFYNFIKHIQGKFKVHFSFADSEKISNIIDDCLALGLNAEQASIMAAKYGKTDMIEYDSISFGRMSQKTFKEYVSNQMPVIYENVLGKFFSDEILSNIIETIEADYERFMQKLI